MSGILNLLNADDLINKQQQQQHSGITTPTESLSSNSSPKLDYSSPQSTLNSPFQPPATKQLTSNKPLVVLRDQIPKSRINKKILNNKKFVKLAIRRKYSTKKIKNDTKQSKLHIKSLKAGIKVKMTLSNNLFSLYHNLIPFTDNRKFYNLFDTNDYQDEQLNSLSNDKNLISKSLQLINNNVVDLSEYSNKILKSFTNGNSTPTFNSLDTALNSLFGTKNFTLVRITRSTTDDIHGSTILKLETATPGDFNLIDDEENSDEMLHSLGKVNEVPNNLFFKKIIARPRYKSNMKIYFIPECLNYSLYTDYRMFERDLFNGIIQLNFENDNDDLNDLKIKRSIGYNRDIYCTFPCDDVLKNYKKSIIESKSIIDQPKQEEEQEVVVVDSKPTVASSTFSSPHQLHPIRAHSMDDSLMMVSNNQSMAPPSISGPPPPQQQQPVGFPPLSRRPSLIVSHHYYPSNSLQGVPSFPLHQQQQQPLPPPNFKYPFTPLQQHPNQQLYFQPRQSIDSNTSPSFIHLPPPPPPPQLPIILPQTPRSSIVRENVLGLLRPFDDSTSISNSKSEPYLDMVNKRRMSIQDY
ncbi:MAG: hypothetical protein M5E90_07445 [Asgard group archaeon]|nr:hypothetical protein [Asgard group archaeon]